VHSVSLWTLTSAQIAQSNTLQNRFNDEPVASKMLQYNAFTSVARFHVVSNYSQHTAQISMKSILCLIYLHDDIQLGSVARRRPIE
jgi:hypothetical protein